MLNIFKAKRSYRNIFSDPSIDSRCKRNKIWAPTYITLKKSVQLKRKVGRGQYEETNEYNETNRKKSPENITNKGINIDTNTPFEPTMVTLLKGTAKLKCEWFNCSFSCSDSNAFDRHVSLHVHEEMAGTQGIYYCMYHFCSFKTQDDKEFLRHVTFHSYHTVLKSIGSNVSKHASLSCCTQNEDTGNKIPNLSTDFICSWKDCTFKCDNTQVYFYHARRHVQYQERKDQRLACNWKNCTSTFQLRSTLQAHIRTHTREKMISCPNCGSLFETIAMFIEHSYHHETLCVKKNFEGDEGLKRYQADKLIMLQSMTCSRRYYCHFCLFKTFRTLSILIEHIKTMHGIIQLRPVNNCDGIAPPDAKESTRIVGEGGAKSLGNITHIKDDFTREEGDQSEAEIIYNSQYHCNICFLKKFPTLLLLIEHIKEEHGINQLRPANNCDCLAPPDKLESPKTVREGMTNSLCQSTDMEEDLAIEGEGQSLTPITKMEVEEPKNGTISEEGGNSLCSHEMEISDGNRNEGDTSNLRCILCPEIFSGESQLNAHLQEKHFVGRPATPGLSNSPTSDVRNTFLTKSKGIERVIDSSSALTSRSELAQSHGSSCSDIPEHNTGEDRAVPSDPRPATSGLSNSPTSDVRNTVLTHSKGIERVIDPSSALTSRSELAQSRGSSSSDIPEQYPGEDRAAPSDPRPNNNEPQEPMEEDPTLNQPLGAPQYKEEDPEDKMEIPQDEVEEPKIVVGTWTRIWRSCTEWDFGWFWRKKPPEK